MPELSPGAMDRERIELRPVGRVESVLTDRADAPRQPDEGAPPAWLVFEPALSEALDGIAVGDEVVVIAWLDRADRETLTVHPRGDATRPTQGVFATRSPDRPNPIGLHVATVAAVEPGRLRVEALEALDGTPILDLKPVLASAISRR